MSVILDANTRVLVYGLETQLARAQYLAMIKSGTWIVGTVGMDASNEEGRLRFPTASDAVRQVGVVQLAAVFSPPDKVLACVLDAIGAGIRTIVCMSEYVPVHDALKIRAHAATANTLVIGPNSSGILTPRQARVGFFCNDLCLPGDVGIVAKSGSVAYAAMSEMKASGLGVSTVLSVGGDLIKGSDYRTLLPLFDQDDETRVILMLGEIGGDDEELAAAFIADCIEKPVVAFVSGRLVKPGQKVGHAAAIVAHGRGGYQSKIDALRAAGIAVASDFFDIVPALQNARQVLQGEPSVQVRIQH